MNEQLLKLNQQLDFHQKEVNRIVNLMIEQSRLSANPLLLIDFDKKLKVKLIDNKDVYMADDDDGGRNDMNYEQVENKYF